MLTFHIFVPACTLRPQGLQPTQSLQLFHRLLEDRQTLTLGKAAAGQLTMLDAMGAARLPEQITHTRRALRDLTWKNTEIARLS